MFVSKSKTMMFAALSCVLLNGAYAASKKPALNCPFPLSSKTYLSKKAAPVFFVDLFGGPWPVPDRYEVLGSSPKGVIKAGQPAGDVFGGFALVQTTCWIDGIRAHFGSN